MAQVRIKVGPRNYTINCGPGDEENVTRYGKLIDENYAKLGTARASQEAENMVFAALFMADELDEAKEAARNAKAELAEMRTALQQAKDDAANALHKASKDSAQDKERNGGAKAELRAEIETLRKAEERARRDNARLKAEITELKEQARHQHDLFGGPAEDAALSEALAEKLEALAVRAERTASELEGGATPA